jgi:hypothetical protein
MRKIYYLLLPVLLCGLAACHKGNGTMGTTTQKAMLLGKWNLQQQHTVLYVDGVKQSDTTLTASAANISNVQFDANGSFASAAVAVFGQTGNLSGGLQTAVDSVKGTYSISASSFELSAPVAGFISSGASFSTGPVPVMTLVSHTDQISKISAASLTLHLEYLINYSTPASTSLHKSVVDYYYNK